MIRSATPDDAPAVAKLHADSWRNHYRGLYADAYLDGDLLADRLAVWSDRLSRPAPSYTFIAEESGVPIGFAHVTLDADPTWGVMVDNLHVSRTAQGKGVGSMLLDRVAKLVAEHRPTSGIFLWVLELNAAATAFYVSRGGVLRDAELSKPPSGDPRNLAGPIRRVRVTWPGPTALLIPD